ncbi:hypothetical protein ACEK07_30340 [Alcanivoracaceae bacterium MT1]
MSNKILKPTMLALAGAVALAAGAANASTTITAPYLLCTYKGNTTLQHAGSQTSCWLTTTMKMDCDSPNHFHVVAAGPVPGDTNCSGLFVGNFPWGGDLADITGTPGTIDTNHTGLLPFSVLNGGTGTPVGGGLVTGVLGSTATTNFACGANTVAMPDFVSISGTNNFGPFPGGPSTLNTNAPNHLQRLSCEYIQ